MWKEDVQCPMRDGCILRANIWLPCNAEGASDFVRLPTLLYRTPYNKNNAPKEWTVFDRIMDQGKFALVVMDVRGRHASEGEFLPYFQEISDGFDSIEWCAAQPWSNGRVATFGISYPAAWQTLSCSGTQCPPHLVACIPAFSYSKPESFIYFGGVFDSSWAWWALTCICPDARRRKNIPGPITDEEAEEEFEREKDRIHSTLPLINVPHFRHVADWYYSWLEHGPTDAEFWGPIDLTSKIPLNIPMVHLSGWYDEAYGPGGAISNYLQQQDHCAASVLIIGPWTHGSPEESKSGDYDFSQEATQKFNYDALVTDFLGDQLMGTSSCQRMARVNLFLMGDNRWLEFDSYPPPSTELTLFLDQNMNLSPGRPAESSIVASVFSDPRNPVTDPFASDYGAHDYSDLLRAKDNRLAVFSIDLQEDLIVVGHLEVSITFSTDAKSLDIWTRVYDNGRNLCQPGCDLQRWTCRESDNQAVHTLLLRDMVTANAFKKGSTLQLAISGSWAPHFSVNLQTGESEHFAAVSVPANFQILSASFIKLPVIK